MIRTALIMAGGHGERFWPRSRKHMPKQFLSLTDDGKTMIQLTVERISSLVKAEDIYIVTNTAYKALVLAQLPGIPEVNVLCEPVGRNTAPCIGLGAMHIAEKYGDALMFVLPSDHLIKFNKMFLKTLEDAGEVAVEGDNLVTIGIIPHYPETGYGYIKFDPRMMDGRAYKVDHFVEKPGLELARDYLESEEYLWNSGIFIWKASSVLKNIKIFLPALYTGLTAIREVAGTTEENSVLEREYTKFYSQSIDYGVMEKAKDIYILPGAFGWDDVGSWLSLERIQKTDASGNAVCGNTLAVRTSNCIIQGEDKLIAAVGLENMIVIDTPDAILICAKDHAAEIKTVIDELEAGGREEYL